MTKYNLLVDTVQCDANLVNMARDRCTPMENPRPTKNKAFPSIRGIEKKKLEKEMYFLHNKGNYSY